MKISSETYAIIVLAALGWSFGFAGDSEIGSGPQFDWSDRRRPAQAKQVNEAPPLPQTLDVKKAQQCS